MKRIAINLFLLLALALFCESAFATDEYGKKDSSRVHKKENRKSDSLFSKIKKGWTFSVLPGISYNVDNGALIGLIANVYDYGDGSTFPNYKHSIYGQVYYTSKQAWVFRFRYDSDHAIPNTNLFADLTYIQSPMTDFYGFNGSQSIYHHEWESSDYPDSYNTRMFYRRESDFFRSLISLRGTIEGPLKWQACLGVLGFIENRVGIEIVDEDITDPTELYQLYREWGVISEAEMNGGWHPYLSLGLAFDNRNRKINPSKGMFIDCFLTYNAAFGNQSHYNNLKLNFDFMHYINLKADRLIFAYKISAQTTVAGRSPYYLNNYQNVLFIERNQYYGLGGMTSVRGMMQNRVWVPGFAYANIELRGRIVDFRIKRQHFYFGANAFFDIGMATQLAEFNEPVIRKNIQSQLDDPYSWMSRNNKSFEDFFNADINPYLPHMGAGIGLKLAMNENFVMSLDWGIPFSKQDNYTIANFYFVLGYQF